MQIHNIICGKKYYEEKDNSSIDDSSWRFDRFYSYCEQELSDICTDRNTLLNYMIHLYYADEKFYDSDKAILWNVFGEDIYNRYSRNELCCNEIVLKKLEKKEKRARVSAEQIKKMCSNANIVNIKDLPDGKIAITDAELDCIVDVLPNDEEAQRLMISLLAIYRKINLNHEKGKMKVIKINKGKKNEITMYQLCKLADIHANQFYNRLKVLHENGLISIDMSNLKVPKITVCLLPHCMDKQEYEIGDINDVRTMILERKLA